MTMMTQKIMHCIFANTNEHDLLFDAKLRLSDHQNKTRGQNHKRGDPQNELRSLAMNIICNQAHPIHGSISSNPLLAAKRQSNPYLKPSPTAQTLWRVMDEERRDSVFRFQKTDIKHMYIFSFPISRDTVAGNAKVASISCHLHSNSIIECIHNTEQNMSWKIWTYRKADLNCHRV